MSDAPPAWYRVAFGEHYRTLYASRDDASARAEAAFAAKVVGLRAGERWIDAACGDGRHLVALRALGADAVGFDLSADLLAAARARGLRRLVRADLRRPPFADASADVVGLFFTSFGYFDDAENRGVLVALRRLLRPRGRIFFDLPDVAALKASLVPESRVATAAGAATYRRRFVGARVEKEVELVPAAGGPPLRYVESVRLYERAELEALLGATGFVVRGAYGGFDGREIGTGDRALFVAETAT